MHRNGVGDIARIKHCMETAMLDFNNNMLCIKHATNNIYGLDVVFVPCSSLYKEQVLPKEVEIANRYQKHNLVTFL